MKADDRGLRLYDVSQFSKEQAINVLNRIKDNIELGIIVGDYESDDLVGVAQEAAFKAILRGIMALEGRE